MAGLRFCFVLAFLVICVGWGLSDAKPIDKPEEKDETTEAAVAKGDSEGDDDSDGATRSKVQKANAKDCKREFHVQGACHPFSDHPEFSDHGGNDNDDDDASVRADRPETESSDSSIKEENKNKDTSDEANAEQDILHAEESPEVSQNEASPEKQDVHTEGEQRDINGGIYNHHSSSCPCMHDLLCQTGHHGHHGHGLHGHGLHGIGIGGNAYGGYGCGCGCTQEAIGPSGACIPPGSCGAGHLGTYVCNTTQCGCEPNFHCSNICGNVALGLPHPECQLCSTQDKTNVECEKTYHPCCSLVNINGNVGLSLPHPGIQLDANQTCHQGVLTGCGGGSCCGGHCSGCGNGDGCGNCGCGNCGCGNCGCGNCGCGNCGCGSCGCGHTTGFGNGGCCHSGFGRDDIKGNTVVASGEEPNEDAATAANADAPNGDAATADASNADAVNADASNANADTTNATEPESENKAPNKKSSGELEDPMQQERRSSVIGLQEHTYYHV